MELWENVFVSINFLSLSQPTEREAGAPWMSHQSIAFIHAHTRRQVKSHQCTYAPKHASVHVFCLWEETVTKNFLIVVLGFYQRSPTHLTCFPNDYCSNVNSQALIWVISSCCFSCVLVHIEKKNMLFGKI